MRGIIVSHTIRTIDNTLRMSGGIEAQDLRRFVLYWDRISYPVVNGIGPNLSTLPDMQFLVDHGVLTLDPVAVPVGEFVPEGFRSRMSVAGMPAELIPFFVGMGQLRIFRERQEVGEIWTIAQLGAQLGFSPIEVGSGHLLETQLHEMLPVPSVEADLEHLLNFKRARSDELQAF